MKIKDLGSLSFNSNGIAYHIGIHDRKTFKLAIHALHIFISEQNIPLKIRLREIENNKNENE